MAVIHLYPENIEIPDSIGDLEGFRRWALSDEFPDRGRIDFLAGRVEVDMSPEDVSTHGTPKVAFVHELASRIEDVDRGIVLSDRSRYSSVQGDLSCEPDVLVVLFESLEAGRVRLVPKSTGEEGRYVEIEGVVDLVVEVVSDSSVTKDTKRLRTLYHRAGVPEYWLADVRKGKTRFEVLIRGPRGYSAAPADREGWAASPILEREARLVRREPRAGVDRFRLETRERPTRRRR